MAFLFTFSTVFANFFLLTLYEQMNLEGGRTYEQTNTQNVGGDIHTNERTDTYVRGDIHTNKLVEGDVHTKERTKSHGHTTALYI